MKNLKLAMIVCGVAGLASCFIGDEALWKAHEAAMVPVLVTIIGFAAAAAMGVMSLNKPMEKWQPIVALVGSIASLWFYQKVGAVGEIFKLTPLIKVHTLNSILWSVGFYGGAIVAIIVLVKGSEKTA